MATLTDFSIRIADAVKAELARRDLSGNDLAEPLGIGRNAVYARLKHERAFDTAELERIVAFLGIDMETLIASAALGSRAA